VTARHEHYAASVAEGANFADAGGMHTPTPLGFRPTIPASDLREHAFHSRLGRFQAKRLLPSLPAPDWIESVRSDSDTSIEEGLFVEGERRMIADRTADVPESPDAFVRWFESLRESGPGQHDALFPWLSADAGLSEMKWFVGQEAGGEAGFDDLVALTQVRLPTRAKIEMARNYWDEMGRGNERGMHGGMLTALLDELALHPSAETTVWESLALSNLMVALAGNRRYAYHAVGALGVVELTAPDRVASVNEGLKRLGLSKRARMYFQLHAAVDIQHSKAWNREVIAPMIESNASAAQAIAEGALMRLASGARCFQRYRRQFNRVAPGEIPFRPRS